jgi:polyisoprenoid-binding protein YceI
VTSSVRAVGAGKYEASGALTIKGITRDVAAPLTLTESAGLRIVEGQLPIKRLQFKVGEGHWSDIETVADEVVVRFRFTIPATR